MNGGLKVLAVGVLLIAMYISYLPKELSKEVLNVIVDGEIVMIIENVRTGECERTIEALRQLAVLHGTVDQMTFKCLRIEYIAPEVFK